jgi:WD40 repeat protein
MTDKRGERLQALFDRAAELPVEQRAAFLDAACPEDPALRAEVEGLLAYDSGSTLDTEAEGRLRSPLVREPHDPSTHSDPVAGQACPARIGDYSILGLLGEGGVGRVYLAQQTSPPRKVALKLLASSEQDEAARQRFRVEAEASARLQHPHIVEIFEVGEDGGRPFLVLEFLEGGSLADRLRQQTMGASEAVVLLQTLARAIHFAHCQGFVHRDLKPGNVLFNRDGLAKIADFGLALAVGNTAGLTHTRQVLGTPAYMAPEQAQADRLRVGPATDVYALGVILYECLTGRRPFPGESPLEIMHAVVHSDPIPPRTHRPELARDLEAICLKCLNKEPERRYPSAWELAEDLERYRKGEPTRARPAGVVERAAKWARRRPAVAALLAALAVVCAVSFALVTWKWREADQQRQTAQGKAEEEARARQEAERLSRELARESSLAMLRLGLNRAEEGFVVQGLHWLARALVLAEDEKLADLDHAIRLNLAHWQQWLILPRSHPFQAKRIRRATASPDGRWLVTVEGPRNSATLWDLVQEHQPELSLGEHVHQVAFNRDSSVLMVASAEEIVSTIRLWRRPDRPGEPAFEPWGPTLHPGGKVEEMRLSPDGRTLVVRLGREVQLWDLARRSLRCPALPCETGENCNEPMGLDETTLFTLGPEDTVCRWDLGTGEPVGRPQKFAPSETNKAGWSRKVSLRALSPDGRTLATAVSDLDGKARVLQEYVWLWDVATGQPRPSSPASRLRLRCLTFSPDGRVLAVTRKPDAGKAEEIQLYDGASGQLLGAPLVHPNDVGHRVFGPDNRVLVTSCSDGRVRFWATATGQPLVQAFIKGEDPAIPSVTFARGVVIAVHGLGGLKMWEVPQGPVGWSSIPAPPEPGLPFEVATLSPDGRTLAVTPFQTAVQTWDLTTGRAVTRPLQHDKHVTSVAFAPEGNELLTGCTDGSVWRWEVPSGRSLGLQVRHPGQISLSRDFRSYLSPDGRTLLTGGTSEVARLWDARTRQPQGSELRHSGRVQGGAFSRDSRQVATASGDGVARVWEAKTGQPLRSLSHPAGVLAAAFSPEGELLLTGCEDGVARLWELESGTLRQSWTHRAPVWHVGFSPDGRTFVTGTGSQEGQVRLWDRATGLPLGPAVGPPGVPELVMWLEFSPESRRLLLGGIGSTLPRLWDLPEPVRGTAREVQSWVRERTRTEMDRGGALLPLHGPRETTP